MSAAATTTNAFSEEETLGQAWNKLMLRLQTEANFNIPLDPSKVPKVEDVIASINPPESDSTTKDHAKLYFKRALKCIDRFAGMVAQGASVVFGPSNQIYNAVSFLIHVSQDVQALFNNLTALMERLCLFLERLGSYMDQERIGMDLNKDLRRVLYRVLEHFVTIMAKSYKLTHEWKELEPRKRRIRWHPSMARVKVVLAVAAFGDDGGIKDEMSKFENLIAEVTKVQIDEIHRTMSVAAQQICDMSTEVHEINATVQEHSTILVQTATSMNQLQDSDKKAQSRKLVLIILGPEADLDNALKTTEGFDDRIGGTGDWILDLHDFQEWKSVRGRRPTVTSYNVFSIQGPEAYGKSYLCETIFNHLRSDLARTDKTFNFLFSKYRFPKDSKGKAVNLAIRSLIWRLALDDPVYMDFLGTACKGYDRNEVQDTLKLWKQLVSEYSKKRPAVVFFLLLDGVDRLDTELWTTLHEFVGLIAFSRNDPEGVRIRLLLTGDSEVFGKMQDIPGLRLPSVDLLPSKSTPSEELKQHEDIKKFVSRQLGDIQIFRGALNQEQEKLRARIIELFPAAARGNYKMLINKLRDVGRSDDLSQVQTVLDRINEDNTETIKRIISELNERLEGQHIRQLNTLFMWIATAETPPNAQLLSSAVAMEFHESGLFKPVEFLKKHCRDLLDIRTIAYSEEEQVVFAPDVVDCLQTSKAQQTRVSEEEIKLIRAFVKAGLERAFGDVSIFEKFEFQTFFKEKEMAQTDLDLIHLNSFEVNSSRLLEACVIAICDYYDSGQYQALREYASYFFGDHLVHTKLDQVDANMKRNIGLRLFRMLREDAMIDVWFDRDHLVSTLRWFDEDNAVCQTLVDWMRDQDVIKGLLAVTTDTSWVSQVTSGAVDKTRILEHVGRRILRRWYELDDDLSWEQDWLHCYFRRNAPEAELYKTLELWEDISIQEAESWEKWARTELKPNSDDAWWLYRMAGAYGHMSFRAGDHETSEFCENACARCEAAVNHDNGLWQARSFRASILFDLERYDECTQQVQNLVDEHGSLLDKDEKFSEAFWNDVTRISGGCHLHFGRLNMAATCYQQAFDRACEKKNFPTAHQYAGYLLNLHIRQGSFDDGRKVLNTLDKQTEKAGQSWLMSMLQDSFSPLHRHMIELAHSSQAYNEMDEYYVSLFMTVKSLEDRNTLEFFRRRLRLRCGPDDERSAALEELEGSAGANKGGWGLGMYWGMLAAQEVAYALRALAIKARLNSADVQVYLERLNTFSEVSRPYIGFWGYKSVALILARLYHVAGNHAQATIVLRSLVQEGIQYAKDEKTTASGFSQLASIFVVLDDDINALAAWSLLEPSRKAKDVIDGTANTVQDPNTVSPASCGPVGAEIDKGVKQRAMYVAKPQTDDVVEPTATASEKKADSSPDTVGSENTAAADKGSSSSPKPAKLKGNSRFSCDGRCERTWSFADDMWVCRDCFDTQLCTDCHHKLLAGQLRILNCNKDHQHLHVPPFDEEGWRALDPNSVRVGSEIITRSQWLTNVKEEWQLHEWILATTEIEVWKRRWLRRRRKAGDRRESTANSSVSTSPGLVRSNTRLDT